MLDVDPDAEPVLAGAAEVVAELPVPAAVPAAAAASSSRALSTRPCS